MGHFPSSTQQYLKAVAEEVNTVNSNIKTHTKQKKLHQTGLDQVTAANWFLYKGQYSLSAVLSQHQTVFPLSLITFSRPF